MKEFFKKFISTICYVLTDKRGEISSPQVAKEKVRKQELLAERRRSHVICDEVNIDGRIFFVNSIFDRKSKETVSDKLKYLIASDTKI